MGPEQWIIKKAKKKNINKKSRKKKIKQEYKY